MKSGITKIREFLAAHPDSTIDEIVTGTNESRDNVHKATSRMCEDGSAVKHPVTYRLTG